jgi:hypothetical protein
MSRVNCSPSQERILMLMTSILNRQWADLMEGTETIVEPHVGFKRRVSQAIGIIRKADTTPYA